MLILAIDPGQKESGYVRWNPELKTLHDAEVVNNLEMLSIVREGIYDHLAIEVIRGYGLVCGDDTFDTCIWIGRFDSEEDALLIPRKEIKRHLCGNTTTTDKYVRQALIDRYGQVGTKKNPGPLFGMSGHMWSALAVAVTAYETRILGRT